jgi:23S rRNA (uridine2552-2'-O)-methyltransferase
MGKYAEIFKKEAYYKKAKLEGYRARSAYKLKDIQMRFNIFKGAYYILDLGCAPGSWLQVIKEYAEENLIKYKDKHYHRDHYKIMGIDLKKVSPIESIKIIQRDINDPAIQREILSYFIEKIDLIVSDASINKTGNKFTDQINQINLCNVILDLTKEILKVRGNIVIKVFQGADFNTFMKRLKQEFISVKSYKPKSSRKISNEIYLIAMQKR